ncbi:hypothetical protein ISN44_As11g001040 [Arabidopsis suecica]|uniref:DUF674 family protein n=1 Tax=Arabidopsis suecica TaxID=45249 RepID=A0A8T1Z5Y3_ARASU|nr:hypothetical protein ISN44_As11g001040 [Arabidopsis suecica]
MAQSFKEPKVSLRLIVDEEKNKVVLAEAGNDFVDVLFSFLMLPIGTIVRLLENHRKSETVTVGCFSNLYKSVVDMDMDNFETAACKEMLLYPRGLKDELWKRFKININPTVGVNKFYTCPNFASCNMCSNFSSSKCKCGRLMNKEILIPEADKVADNMKNDVDGVFIRGRYSFIITDDLKVSVDSTGLVLKTLGSLGYADVSKLGERLLDIGLGEVLTLLECIFSSNTPLTDTFLKKQRLHDVSQISKQLSPRVKEKDEAVLLSLDVIVKKEDMKVLYVECCEDFVDLLFTFLAVPLESIWDFTGNNITLGCIGNLHRSLSDLSVIKKTRVSSFSCTLPCYYRCRKQFPMITTQEPRVYYRFSNSNVRHSYCLTTKHTTRRMTFVDPKSDYCDRSKDGKGFVKRGTKFIVSDDLIVTPKISSSTFSMLKKFQILTDDLEVQAITISNAEALNLLTASLVTSSALSSAFGNLIVKKPKEETVSWNPVSKKPKVET